jgi:diguanylate cyclase (GGDEF)-like protein
LRVRLVQRQRKLADEVVAVHRLATHDLLTGALNRHAILPMLEEQIHLVQRGRQACALALIDLDHFKRVNDGHGHLVGDQVLCRVVDTMNATLRPSDKLARYGGEEFLLLMPATTLEEALVVLERVRLAVAHQSWQDLVADLPITLSAGITHVHARDRLDDVLARADTSLYQAKNEGRNRCVCLAAN